MRSNRKHLVNNFYSNLCSFQIRPILVATILSTISIGLQAVSGNRQNASKSTLKCEIIQEWKQIESYWLSKVLQCLSLRKNISRKIYQVKLYQVLLTLKGDPVLVLEGRAEEGAGITAFDLAGVTLTKTFWFLFWFCEITRFSEIYLEQIDFTIQNPTPQSVNFVCRLHHTKH